MSASNSDAKNRYYELLLDRIGPNIPKDNKGNIYMTCPNCKAENNHFSFSINGSNCFKCGYRPTFKQLLQDLGQEVVITTQVAAPRREPRWKSITKDLVKQFVQHPEVVERWQAYKPVPECVIRERALGYGVFPDLWHSAGTGQSDWRDPQGNPHWKCAHPRLIVPMICQDKVVGFRCRSIDCDCPRWLSPRGSKLVLYNGGRIGIPNMENRLGDTDEHEVSELLWIGENPIDALLVEYGWGIGAVGTLGVTIWRKEWTRLIAELGIQTIVAFDNDASGNANTARAMAAWKTSHPEIAPPRRGPRLNQTLVKNNVSSTLYRWEESDPVGMDTGDLFMGKPNVTIALAQWFVTHILEREWTTDDYRSAHTKHAAELLKHHSVKEICGTLDALHDGVIGNDFKLQYMISIETLGEPPFVAQYRNYLAEEPLVYLEDEHNQWEKLNERTYVEIAGMESATDVQLRAGEPMRPDNGETRRPRLRKNVVAKPLPEFHQGQLLPRPGEKAD